MSRGPRMSDADIMNDWKTGLGQWLWTLMGVCRAEVSFIESYTEVSSWKRKEKLRKMGEIWGVGEVSNRRKCLWTLLSRVFIGPWQKLDTTEMISNDICWWLEFSFLGPLEGCMYAHPGPTSQMVVLGRWSTTSVSDSSFVSYLPGCQGLIIWSVFLPPALQLPWVLFIELFFVLTFVSLALP